MHTSSNDTRGRNMGTHHPNKEQAIAAAQTKMERSMLNITYRDRKTNIRVREKTQVTEVNMSEDGSRPGQGTSAGYEITDGHCVLPPGNPTKGKDLEESRRDGEVTN